MYAYEMMKHVARVRVPKMVISFHSSSLNFGLPSLTACRRSTCLCAPLSIFSLSRDLTSGLQVFTQECEAGRVTGHSSSHEYLRKVYRSFNVACKMYISPKDSLNIPVCRGVHLALLSSSQFLNNNATVRVL